MEPCRSIVLNEGAILYDDYCHRPFICTNELNHAEVVRDLRELPAKGNTLLGVSCFPLLNMAVERPIDLQELSIVIIDRGTRVIDFWKTILPKIQSSQSRSEFLEELSDLYYEKQPVWGKGLPTHMDYGGSLKFLQKELFNEQVSWCSNDRSFKIIQTIIAKDNFKVIPGDISRKEDASFIKMYLDGLGKKVDTFYLSNCHEYTNPKSPEWMNLLDTVEIFGSETNPYIITTLPRKYSPKDRTKPMSSDLCQICVPYDSKELLHSFWTRHGSSTFFSVNVHLLSSQNEVASIF